MVNQEEARVRLSVDSTQIAAGMKTATATMAKEFNANSSVIEGSMKKTMQSLKQLVSINFVSLIQGTLEKVFDWYSQKIADFVYQSEAMGIKSGRLEKEREQIHAARNAEKQAQQSALKLQEQIADSRFKEATDAEKVKILDEQMAENRAKQETARAHLASFNGAKTAERFQAEKELNDLTAEGLKLYDQQKAITKEIAADREKEVDKKRQQEIDDHIAAMDREVELAHKKQETWRGQMDRETQLSHQLERSAKDRFAPSLGDIANSGGRFARTAQRIQFLEQDTVLANAKGNFEYAQGNVREIDRLTKQLVSAGVLKDPNAAVVKELESLREMMRKEGIQVKPFDTGE